MKRFSVFAVASLALSINLASSKADAATLICPALDKISQVFLNQHISHNDATETIENRTVDQYIKRLDSTKIYLTDADVATIKKQMKGIFNKLRKGDCDALDQVQKTYLSRVEERAAFAKKTLGAKTFKFEQGTELMLDPDKRKFAKTKAESEALQAKYLQFQISNYLATGMKQDEAQEQVVRNYERVVKRVKETTKEDIYSGYLDSFARALDPHSSYFSADALADFEISMSLSLEGIGATLSSQDGFTVIEQLIDGGSAKASGKLNPQDKIVAVGQFKATGEASDMDNVIEMDLRDVVKKIRGPKGSKVRLQVLRKGTDGGTERFFVDLVRDKIKLEEDAAAINYIEKEVNGQKRKIAVLNLPSFYADSRRGGRSSAGDMERLLKDAKDKGAESLVLDLSMNGGGSLEDAVKIAGLFFKTGNVVKQSSRDKNEPAAILDDRNPAVNWDGPMVVLTSRISASASEIVAGTLKDYSRAVVVGGDHTFGKGSVQSVVPLPPQLGAVKVTVGMFYTPGGFSTQHRGVFGDVVLPGVFSTDEMGEKSLDYSLEPAKIKSFLSTEAFVNSGAGAWKKVDAPIVNQLKSRSAVRVAANPEFQKIITEAKKAEASAKKPVKLAEVLKDTKEKKDEADSKKNLNKEQKAVEYLKRPEVQEAANVAADLLALQSGTVLSDATKPAQETKPTAKTN
ncbi:MAG TPA: S41 family peptidase [Bdellovibrionales bacterium]|nr:S41 family peptidase [Bdellovibrionales bacterium]